MFTLLSIPCVRGRQYLQCFRNKILLVRNNLKRKIQRFFWTASNIWCLSPSPPQYLASSWQGDLSGLQRAPPDPLWWRPRPGQEDLRLWGRGGRRAGAVRVAPHLLLDAAGPDHAALLSVCLFQSKTFTFSRAACNINWSISGCTTTRPGRLQLRW